MMMMDPAEALLRSRCKEKKQLITLQQVTTRWPAPAGRELLLLVFNYYLTSCVYTRTFMISISGSA